MCVRMRAWSNRAINNRRRPRVPLDPKSIPTVRTFFETLNRFDVAIEAIDPCTYWLGDTNVLTQLRQFAVQYVVSWNRHGQPSTMFAGFKPRCSKQSLVD